MSTLTIPPVLVSPRDDAIQLYRAFKGLGCDTAAVVNILAHRDATQRALIQQEYRTMYSHDLMKHLSSELSGNVEKAILLWMQDPAGRDATIVRQALSGDLIDLEAATEVICSRTPSQIQQFKQIYHVKFGAYLEHDIEFCASGDHKKLLLAYVSTPRYEGLEHDRMMAENDAKALFKAGEKRLGTDEKTFIHIFSGRSRAHLAAVSSAYRSMYGNSLKKTVKKETSGNFEYALLTILRCSENPAKYFARVLYKAMKGLGTNDTTLIRVIVSRTEIDMQYIKAEYQKKYKKTLNGAVHSETSADVVEEQWAIIVECWNSQNAQNLSARNKTNCANQTLNHTAGTKSFARVRNEQGLVGRVETFIKTHTRKDGTPINDEAADKIDQMRTIMEQGTPDSTARDDVYTQVMGHDIHGRVRCCGLGHTPTRLWGGSASSSTSSRYVDMDEFNRMREQLQRTEERLEEEMRQRQTIEATVAQHAREFEEFRNFMMSKRQTQSPGETSANDSPPRDFS